MELISNPAPRILVAVDDPDLRRITVAGLRAGGFCVSAPTDGEAAMLLAESFSPDVLVVGARLLSPDGRPLYEALRESSEQYLVCITDEGATRTRASVLLAGADDAVSVPLSPDELTARCHALLRRPRQMRHRGDIPAATTLAFSAASTRSNPRRVPTSTAPPPASRNAIELSGPRPGMAVTSTWRIAAFASMTSMPASVPTHRRPSAAASSPTTLSEEMLCGFVESWRKCANLELPGTSLSRPPA